MRVVGGAAGLVCLAALAACTPASTQVSPGPDPLTATPSVTVTDGGGAPTITVESMIAAADRVVDVPSETTALISTGLIGEPVPSDGGIVAIAPGGELLAGFRDDVGEYYLARMGLGGSPERVDESYQTFGEASQPDGSASWPVISTDAMAWLAYSKAVDDLNTLDYTVYASDRLGGNIHRIGQSGPDVTDMGAGSNLQVPLWRAGLFLSGGRAFWMESVRRVGNVADPIVVDGESVIGVAVMSAPVDGSAGQIETLQGWNPTEDLCSPVDAPAIVYLDSAFSQVPDTGTASVHRAVVAPDGTVNSDEVVWSAPEDLAGGGAYALAAAACDDTVAVSWSGAPDEAVGLQPAVLLIVHNGMTTAITDPQSGFFSRMRVTPRAVFFEGANGSVDGGLYVYELDTRALYRIVLAEGRYDTLLVTRTVVSWLQDNPDAPDPEFPWSFYAAELLR